MPTTEPTNKTPKQSRAKLWLKRAASLSFVLVLVVVAVSWYAQSRARREVIKQLASLNEGPIELGHVSIGWNGIRVSDVKLFQPGASEPWAVAGELNIDAPLAQLIASPPAIDRIVIEDPRLTLQLDADGNLLNSFPTSSSSGLPASAIEIRNASLTIEQPGHDSLTASRVDITVSEGDAATKFQGNIKDLAGASWNLSGSFQSQQKTFSLNAATNLLMLDSSQLSRWPSIPGAALEQIGFSGATTVNIDAHSAAGGTIDYQVNLQPQDVELRIHPFDLQIQLQKGDLQIRNGKLTVQDLLANVDDGVIIVSGEADFTTWPIIGSFAGNVQKLPVDTLRHLAPIPEAAKGFAFGETTGSFSIGGGSTFSMVLSAEGRGEQATYEGFAAEGTQVGVEIQSLKLDETFQLSELTGNVKVDTTVNHLAVAKFLDRFGIKPEDAAPRIEGDAQAKVNLLIPLATAADVGSWSLAVNAACERVSLASKLLKDVTANIGIEAGMLTFEQLMGDVSHDSLNADSLAALGRVSLTGKWPFRQDRLASFEIRGTEVSVAWLAGIAKDYSADVEEVLKIIDRNYDKESSSLGGKLTVTVKIEFPPAAAKDFSKWTISGEVTTGEISIDQRSISNIKSQFKLADGLFALEKFAGDLSGGGTISVSGTVPLDNKQQGNADVSLKQAPARFDVQWSQVPLVFLSEMAGVSLSALRGELSGNLHVERSIALAEKPAAWSATGEVSASKLAWGDIALAETRFRIATTAGLISATDFQYGRDPIGFDLQATIASSAPYDYRVGVKVNDFDLARLGKIDGIKNVLDRALPLKGIAQFEGQLSGSLQPFAFASSGAAAIADLEIAERHFDDVASRWEFNSADLNNAQGSLDIFGGRIQLDKFSADPAVILATIENLDAEQIAAIMNVPGSLAGKLNGSLAAEAWTRAETRTARLQLAGISAVAGPLRLSELTGELTYGDQQLSYQLAANLLAGEFTATGKTDLPADGWNNIQIPLACKLTDANLNQLSRESQALAGLNNLGGSADANFELNLNGPDFQPEGTGNANVRNVTWKSQSLISTASALVSIKENVFNVREFRADAGGGEISGKAMYPLTKGQVGNYDLNVRRVDLATALIFWPAVAEDASGYLEARIAGTLDRTLSGAGQVAFEKASVYDIAGQSLRLPIQFQINLVDFSGRAEVRRTRLRMFDGAVSAKASLEFGNRLNLDADATLSDIDSGELIGLFTDTRDYDQGELSGTLTLKGRSVRSIRDLQGSFSGSLERSQSFKLPLLDKIGAFLSSGRLTQTTFDSDEIELRLANGLVQVNKFTFTSSIAQILITGNVSTDQRLDLDVAAQIENLNVNPLVQRYLQSPLSRLQPAPTAIATEFARLVSNRMIYLHVGGTTRSPSFQLQTGLILRDEALQFFLGSATIPGIPDIRNIPQNR